MTNPSHRFTFYPKPNYLQDITERVAQASAGERIALQTMTFKPYRPETGSLIDALAAAAARGAHVSLAVDARIFLSADSNLPGPAFFYGNKLPRNLPKKFRLKLEALELLRLHGVRCVVTNRPTRAMTNPHAGRSHIKFAIIGNRVYVGGCNLTSVESLDVMVGWDDARTADWLYDISQAIVAAESSKLALNSQDQIFTVDPAAELLIDAGVRRQSIIFQRALQLIDRAKKQVLITCQYFPNSITTKHLVQAHRRGVDVTILYNHPSKHGIDTMLHHLVVLRERARTPAALFRQQLPRTHHFLHAKIIATEQAAIIGSHNYVAAGVNFGTAEIALLVRDPAFAAKAHDFALRLVA